ncbi:hypothetical protein [Aliikangiella sp. IMCC44359]|uniref:hypothetical protein n=1 Tax=Aliikangiella sp. IMCC44359 TaxID=3459125 RepID=UPI00403AAFDA
MKFEFGDLYKFTVSLGVVLITLSIVAPWLFLKEPFDLFRPESEIKVLSEVAQSVIKKRQDTVSFIIQFIPWFSTIGAVVGLILIFLGLKNWHRNQIHLDEQTRLDVELKKQSLRDATSDEIEEKETAEYEELKVAESSNAEAYLVNSFRGQYSKIEELVYTKLKDTYQGKYKVNHNKMISNVELDILLIGKSVLTKDYIIEVKYIRKGFNFGWLREAFLKNIYAKSVYSQITNRMPNTMLLIVIEPEAYDENKYTRLLQKLNDEPEARKGKDAVCLITKQELMAFKSSELQDRLSIHA